MKVKLLSRVRLLATPWTAAYQAPPSMGFSRQEYWSGVPLPSPFSPKGWRKWCCTRLILQLYNLPPFHLYTPHPTEARHHWEITLLKKKKQDMPFTIFGGTVLPLSLIYGLRGNLFPLLALVFCIGKRRRSPVIVHASIKFYNTNG